MIIILVRIVICVVLFCFPLLVYIWASRKPDNALWLIFPLFGGIPAVFGALFVFVPLEIFLDAQALGHLKNVAVPLSGALLVVFFIIFAWGISGNLSKVPERIATGGVHFVVPVLFWSFLGVVWGGLWRLSDWLVGLIRLGERLS